MRELAEGHEDIHWSTYKKHSDGTWTEPSNSAVSYDSFSTSTSLPSNLYRSENPKPLNQSKQNKHALLQYSLHHPSHGLQHCRRGPSCRRSRHPGHHHCKKRRSPNHQAPHGSSVWWISLLPVLWWQRLWIWWNLHMHWLPHLLSNALCLDLVSCLRRCPKGRVMDREMSQEALEIVRWSQIHSGSYRLCVHWQIGTNELR